MYNSMVADVNLADHAEVWLIARAVVFPGRSCRLRIGCRSFVVGLDVCLISTNVAYLAMNLSSTYSGTLIEDQ